MGPNKIANWLSKCPQNLRDQVIASQQADKRAAMMTWFDLISFLLFWYYYEYVMILLWICDDISFPTFFIFFQDASFPISSKYTFSDSLKIYRFRFAPNISFIFSYHILYFFTYFLKIFLFRFENLMEGIERTLLTKNRDRFTQNLSVFRRDINDSLKGPNVTTATSVNDMMTS